MHKANNILLLLYNYQRDNKIQNFVDLYVVVFSLDYVFINVQLH